MAIRGVLLDVDGTLVDSNDAHARAWVDAFAEGGHAVAFARVRPLIGMGGDQLLPRVLGIAKDTPEGKWLSDRWAAIFEERYLPAVRAFPGTRALVQRLRDRGLRPIAASSAKAEHLDALLAIAEVRDLLPETTSADDAERSKPAPDIIRAALDKLGLPAAAAALLGDTPYDIAAARQAGVRTIALRCGGWGDRELAGALAIYDDPADLLARYDDSPLGRAATA